MNNIESMEVSNSTNNMFEIATSLCLFYFGIFDDKIKKLPILDVFHD